MKYKQGELKDDKQDKSRCVEREYMKKYFLMLFVTTMLFTCLTANINNPFYPTTTYGSGNQLHAIIRINGVSVNSEDRLIATVGNEIRVNDTMRFSGGQTLLGAQATPVLQTLNAGETIHYYLWRQSVQEIFQTATTSMTTGPGGSIGTATNPIIINFTIRTLSISGRITHLTELTPIGNVEIFISNALPAYINHFFSSLETNSQGYYAIPNLPIGTSTISYLPLSTTYYFQPANDTKTNLTQSVSQHFVAVPLPTYTVSGYIMFNGTVPLSGVHVGTTSTDDNGFYSFPLTQNHGITLSPNKPNWAFNPPTSEIVLISQNEVRNFDAIPANFFTITGVLDVSEFTINIQSQISSIPASMFFPNFEFEIPSIVPGDNITIVPEKEGYYFHPASITILNILTNRNVSFDTQIAMYDVSGSVIYGDTGNPMIGVPIFTGDILLAQTNNNGNYSFVVEHGTDITFFPKATGYQFVPENITLENVSSDIEYIDFVSNAIPVYTLSFEVYNVDNPVSEVDILCKIDDNIFEILTTDINGIATITLNETDDVITFMPLKDGYYFYPSEIVIDGLNADAEYIFNSFALTFNVSGHVLLNNVGLSGVEISTVGFETGPVYTIENGSYNIPNVPFGTNMTIVPLLEGYTFIPENISLNNIVNDTFNQNFIAEHIVIPLTVIALDYLESPISGIQVNFTSSQGTHFGGGTTNINGEYVFIAHYGNLYTISISNTGTHLFDQTLINTGIITSSETFFFISRPRYEFELTFFVLSQNMPLSGVHITYQETNGDSGYAMTNIDGIATFTLLETSNSIIFTPTKAGYNFTPEAHILNHLTQGTQLQYVFNATIETFSISGTVLENGYGLPGVRIFTIGFETSPIFTVENGTYYIPDVPFGTDLTISPYRAGFSFVPESIPIYNINSNFQNQDFVAAGVIIPITVSTKDYNEIPIAGILVSFISTPNSHTGFGSTGSNGTFIFNAHYGENYAISISNLGAHLFMQTSQLINNVTGAETILFQTRPAEEITITFEVLSQGAPLSEVNIFYEIELGHSGNITTNDDGIATLSIFETNQSASFIPVKDGYTFNPPNIVLPSLTLETSPSHSFSANIKTFSVAGSVFLNEEGLSLVRIDIDGFGISPVFTETDGSYLISDIPFGSSFSLVPKRDGFSFLPPSIQINHITNDITNQNFTAAGIVIPISVSTIDYNQEPIMDIQINYSSLQSSHAGFGNTNVNGSFLFYANYGESYHVYLTNVGQHIFLISAINTGILTAEDSFIFYTRARNEYTLSGTITAIENNTPLSNINVRLNYAGNFEDIFTDDDGVYSKTIYENDHFVIEPHHVHYRFNPLSINIENVGTDYLNQNFVAEIIEYPIRGEILLNNQPLPGVVVQNIGNIVDTTNESGYFEFFVLHGETLDLVFIHDDYTFNPSSVYVEAVEGPVNYLVIEASFVQFTVSGLVLNQNIPVEAVRVFDTFSNREFLTQNDGYFEFQFDIYSALNIKAEKAFYTIPDSIFTQSITSDIHKTFHSTANCTDVLFSTAPGVYYQPIIVELQNDTDGAVIFFTLDGSTPTESSFIYSQPFIVNNNAELFIRARAFKAQYTPSAIAEGYFKVTGIAASPTIHIPSGQYFEALNVEISAESESIIYYTLNGESPTENSLVYSTPVFINKNTLLKAIAVKDGYLPSNESVAMYEISHIIDFELPEFIEIMSNESKILNFLDYIHDSVEGEHVYHISYLSTLQHISIDINENFVTFTPFEDWLGEETIEFEVKYIVSPIRSELYRDVKQTFNVATSEINVIVYSDLGPPIIHNFYPETDDGHVTFPLYTTIGFFVNPAVGQPDLSFEWYVNGKSQNHDYSLFDYTLTDIEQFEIYVEVSNKLHTVSMIWYVTVEVSDENIPEEYKFDKLLGNYPNPFNPETTIVFNLAESEIVNISIYNTRGQFVEEITNQRFPKGINEVIWNSQGNSSGIYMVTFKTVNHYEIKRIVLLK